MTQTSTVRRRFLYNSNAGHKTGVHAAPTSVEEIRALMEHYGLGDELIETPDEDAAISATRDAVRCGYDVVVGVGGDGTAGLIARELLGTNTALGMLPCGSVMNIGRMLGIPRETDGAAAILATGLIQAVDVGEVKGRIFFEAASVGLNAPVFQAAQRFDAGQRRSILEAIWIAIRYRPARMTIRLDEGVIVTRALMVTIANGAYTGIGFTVAPLARVDDGLFDISVFRKFSRTGLLLHFARIAFGRRSYSPKVSTYRSRVVEVSSAHPLPCRADANDLGTTPVTFTCLQGQLRVVVPGPDVSRS